MELAFSKAPKSPQVVPEIDRIMSKNRFAAFEALRVLRFRHASWAFLGLLPEGRELSAFFDVR
jgi:hypothetical protein